MLHLTEEETDLLSQENQFLKQTIFNLRIEMEKSSHEQATLIQNKTAEFTNAKKELEIIITRQRSEIEIANSKITDEIQKVTARQSKEQSLLKKVIQELRNELEHESHSIENKRINTRTIRPVLATGISGC